MVLMVPSHATIVPRRPVGLAAASGTHIRWGGSATWSRVETHIRRVLQGKEVRYPTSYAELTKYPFACTRPPNIYVPIFNVALMIAEQRLVIVVSRSRCGTEGNISYYSNNDDSVSGRRDAQLLCPRPYSHFARLPRNGVCCTDGKPPEVGHRFPHHGTASGATSDKNVMPGPEMKPRISRREMHSSFANTEDA